MRIVIVGPGRAGLALAMAASGVGHQVAAVVGRDSGHATPGATLVGSTPLALGDPLPDNDLVVIAARDGDIADVAIALAASPGPVTAAVHMSGLASVACARPAGREGRRHRLVPPTADAPHP